MQTQQKGDLLRDEFCTEDRNPPLLSFFVSLDQLGGGIYFIMAKNLSLDMIVENQGVLRISLVL